MTDDLNPALQSLFANAKQDMEGEQFTVQVMSRVGSLERRVVFIRVCAGLVFAACAWLLASPLLDLANFMTHSVSISLIDLDSPLLAQTLSPVNNVAAVLALGVIGLRRAYKTIFC
ncbi:MAG: hypothetical protein HN725_18775 [Alphaproteobacteria bacterium]|jgi:hypothetical protein|nr:hypothetical protein [Alphaproteobacteria bacterium]MBT4086788.1 hypothetical protein [Alphaproteobacteria bacterium]MBT4542461.1 hypothetical protein [Alphaproteobacteria bacterium]MBT7747339.1 hypothetical protein [Alphaproteobacteria bacterium]